MTASLLFLIHGRRDGESGEARRDRATPRPGRDDPTAHPVPRACGAPPSVETEFPTLSARGLLRDFVGARRSRSGGPQEGLDASRGRQEPGGVRRASRPSLRGIRADPGALGTARGRIRRTARRGPGHLTSLAFPLRASSGVPGPRLAFTLGGRRGEGQRAGALPPSSLWTGLWTTSGEPVDKRWNPARRLGRRCGTTSGARPREPADQRQCRAPGVDGKSWARERARRPAEGVR
jgi:hypothetical protein